MTVEATSVRGEVTAMIEIIEEKKSRIVALCKQYGIRKLDLFGSATTGAFDPASSDLDFVVDLGEYDDGIADRYLDLAEALESLFGRPVDLVTEQSIRNPYLRYQIESQRVPIYGNGDSQAVA